MSCDFFLMVMEPKMTKRGLWHLLLGVPKGVGSSESQLLHLDQTLVPAHSIGSLYPGQTFAGRRQIIVSHMPGPDQLYACCSVICLDQTLIPLIYLAQTF